MRDTVSQRAFGRKLQCMSFNAHIPELQIMLFLETGMILSIVRAIMLNNAKFLDAFFLLVWGG